MKSYQVIFFLIISVVQIYAMKPKSYQSDTTKPDEEALLARYQKALAVKKNATIPVDEMPMLEAEIKSFDGARESLVILESLKDSVTQGRNVFPKVRHVVMSDVKGSGKGNYAELLAKILHVSLYYVDCFDVVNKLNEQGRPKKELVPLLLQEIASYKAKADPMCCVLVSNFFPLAYHVQSICTTTDIINDITRHIYSLTDIDKGLVVVSKLKEEIFARVLGDLYTERMKCRYFNSSAGTSYPLFVGVKQKTSFDHSADSSAKTFCACFNSYM